MSDACGCSDEKTGTGESEEVAEAAGFWQVREVRAAAVSGFLLLAAWIASLIGGPQWLTLPLEVIALLVAAWTFVPSTLRRLAKGKIGVGTLMTIAAAGAVALGQYEEAAMLAFLYAISEGLEEYSMAKTRRGLRALLDLVPAEATVLRGGIEITVPRQNSPPETGWLSGPANVWQLTAGSSPAARPWTPRRLPANPSRSRPGREARSLPGRLTAPVRSRLK